MASPTATPRKSDLCAASRYTFGALLAESAERALNGVDQPLALDNLELEHDNFRAVLGWSLSTEPEPGLRLITALGPCWQMRGHLLEGYRWSQTLLALGQRSDPRVRARALYSASVLAFRLGDNHQSELFSQESLGLARQADDPMIVAWSLDALGTAMIRPHMTVEDYRQAHACFDEALPIFRALNSTLGIAKCLTHKGEVCRLQGEFALAAAYYQESITLDAQMGNLGGRCVNLANLGWVTLRLGDPARAEACFRESQQLAQQIGYKSLMIDTLAGLAGVATLAGHSEQAGRLFGTVDAQRAIYQDALCAADLEDYERGVAAARAQLDPATFAQLWAEGRELTLEQAIASATPE